MVGYLSIVLLVLHLYSPSNMSSAGHVEQAIRGNGGVESTRGLPHIPLEILQQIACHLDRKSAFALTLTCKGLRDAGETKLYETVHLDHDYENLHGTSRDSP